MDSTSESSCTCSHFGIEKLQDDNYHIWSFQCQMLLAEKKVWDIVSGKSPPPSKPSPPADDQGMTVAEQRKVESDYRKQINDWNSENNAWYERNDEALCVITFTVVDSLFAPIHYANGNARAAWLELEKVHAPKDKQRKYSLLKCLY